MDPIVNNTTKQVQTVSTVKFKCMSVCGRWRSLFKISKGGDMNNETTFLGVCIDQVELNLVDFLI